MTNSPVVFGPGGMSPRPELYGLAIYARMIGAGAELLSVRLDPPQDPTLKAWAVRSGRHVRLLLINKAAQPVIAIVGRPAGVSGSGSLSRLLAPSVAATHGVTLAGQTIGPDGHWHGHLVVETTHAHSGGYGLAVAGYSAVLLDLR